MRKTGVLITMVLLAVFLPGAAQAAYELTGWGARPTGLAGAYSAIGDDVNSVFFNPAGIARLKHGEFIAMESRPYMGLELKVWDNDTNAYESMGRMMLEHCDILVAVWDDQHEGGEGGTSHIVRLAKDKQLPIIWIHPNLPYDQVILNGIQILSCQLLTQVVHNLIRPPWLSGKDAHPDFNARKNPDATGSYINSKTQKKTILGVFWNIFMKSMLCGVSLPEIPEEPSFPEFSDPLFQQHKAIIDTSAERLAGNYRGAFLANYTLGICAVFFELLSYASHSYHYF